MAKKRIELTWIEPGTKLKNAVSITADLDTEKNQLAIVDVDCIPSGVKICTALVPHPPCKKLTQTCSKFHP